ncbi:diguanylate cyclase [Mycolicibacterium sp. 050158]|uniref:diguanylate cyclase n=1 Tax=Mycolicibacterium sp. 050158 TaxID=3090602 RepID=UPI00299ED75F|nr:diguanylate cyclase [Mycolicibacterium sp. 050158]MDX1890725.1 diguanylate cyclase [Mycolicibacterium sp. 050158]
MHDRRRNDPPTATIDYLNRMPAVVLLDRLTAPVLGIDVDGQVAYANWAFARLLGRADPGRLLGGDVRHLLVGAHASAPECAAALRAAGGKLVGWVHSEGFTVQTLVSETMLQRADDPLILISVTDMTEWSWNTRG